MGRFDPGRILVMINRNEYWQLAYVIAKGTLDKVRAAGLDAFRETVVNVAPYLADRMGEIQSEIFTHLVPSHCCMKAE